MVTHDLRLCQYVDRVIQMLDGQIQRVVDDPDEIYALANTGRPESLQAPLVVTTPPAKVRLNGKQLAPMTAF